MESTFSPTRQDIPTAPQASDAWIAPEGQFFYVREWGHNYVAETFLGDQTGGDRLMTLGWMHVSAGHVSVRGATQAQLNTLWDTVRAYVARGGARADVIVVEYNDLLDGTQ